MKVQYKLDVCDRVKVSFWQKALTKNNGINKGKEIIKTRLVISGIEDSWEGKRSSWVLYED